jgi:hypothetical protein
MNESRDIMIFSGEENRKFRMDRCAPVTAIIVIAMIVTSCMPIPRIFREKQRSYAEDYRADYSGTVRGKLRSLDFRPIVRTHVKRYAYPIRNPWMSGTLTLKAGTTYCIQCSGLASTSSRKGYLWIGPEGTDSGYVNDLSEREPRLPRYAMIAKLGESGNPFWLGKECEVTPREDAVLFLGYSDDYHGDNNGFYVIDIFESSSAELDEALEPISGTRWKYSGD